MTYLPSEYKSTAFWDVATSRAVVTRATRVALVVGTVLAAINHGDKLLLGELDFSSTVKILVTFCVPYSVSTYSSVLAVREFAEKIGKNQFQKGDTTE